MKRSEISGSIVSAAGRKFVIIPQEEYERLVGRNLVEGVPFVDGVIAHRLTAAREKANLSQAQLAKLLGKTQPMVARAESGQGRVGSKYVNAVLAACGLPLDWTP